MNASEMEPTKLLRAWLREEFQAERDRHRDLLAQEREKILSELNGWKRLIEERLNRQGYEVHRLETEIETLASFRKWIDRWSKEGKRNG